MTEWIIIYTAADGSWLGYNMFRCEAAHAQEAERKFLDDREWHPMRMRYSYLVMRKEMPWMEHDSRK